MKKYILLLVFFSMVVSTHAQETFKSFNELGQKELDEQNYQEALVYYDKALAIGSDNKSELIWTATVASMCATQLGDEKLAMKYNNIAITNGAIDLYLIDQQLEFAKKYKDNETTEQVLLIARNIEGKREKYSKKLLYFYYNNKRYAETIDIADEILSLQPEHTNSLYFKGVALLKTKKEDEALILFKDILSREPNHAKANLQTGFIYYNRTSVEFERVNKNYLKLKDPTTLQYESYRKEAKKATLGYKTCLPYLEKYNEQYTSKSVTDAINRAKKRLASW